MVSPYGVVNAKKATARLLRDMPLIIDKIRELRIAEENRLVDIAIKDLKAGCCVRLPENINPQST